MIRPSRGVFAVVLLGWAIVGCARPQAPEGGAIPEISLRVSETRPQNLSIVEPFDGPVEIRFTETLSERLTQGSPTDAVVVSPRSGGIEAGVTGDRIEISMEGGFQPGVVYRVTVLPRFQDRFQNDMDRPFDLLFSTGPAFEPNLMAGLVSDRLTLDPVSEARVDATTPNEETVLTAVADTAGIFAFPYLPSGAYRVVAYRDGDRNEEPGFSEIRDSVEIVVTPGDTLIVTDLELLAPDTTAAVLEEVAVVDSMAFQVTFDDYLDPSEPLDGVQAVVTPEEGAPIEVAEVLHLADWEARHTAAAEPEPDAAAAGGPAGAGPLLPAQSLVLVLSVPPAVDDVYEVEMEGVRNINAVPNGGGSGEVTVTAPPPPPLPPDPDALEGADAPGDTDTPPDSTVVPARGPDTPVAPPGAPC